MVLLKHDSADQELLSQVAPEDWRNPQPQALYDLVVIGGGTAGLISAAIAAGLGAKVAMIERELLGGDCLNYGCVPSKGLLSVSRRLGSLRRGSDYGLSPADGDADFAKVMQRMRELRAGISHHDGAARFRDLGVDVFLGEGSFTSEASVQVRQRDDNLVELNFKRAVIATGARPLVFPVPGLDKVSYHTNLSLFSLTELPESLAIVGAGPIGIEMAQAFARFGSKVTVIAMDSRILPREDPEAAAVVRTALERDGVRFELNAKMSSASERDGKKVVGFERTGRPVEAVEQDGTADTDGEVVASELLLALGRTPNVEGLGLEQAGVDFDRRGIKVNDHLRSTNKRIFAAGDVAGSFQFTHAADAMARLVIRNAFFFGRGKVSDLTMPWSTYTDPEVAHVGLYLSDAEQAGVELDSLRMDFEEIDRNILEGQTEGFAKVIFEKSSGKLRGATVVGAHAGELLGEMLVAVNKRMKVSELSSVIHPYPTSVSIWGRIGDKASGARLTPGVAKLLKRIIGWRR